MKQLIKKKITLNLTLFVLLFSPAFSQRTDLEKFGDHGENILKTATRFESHDLLNYGVTLGTTFLAYQIDEDVNSYFRNNKSSFLNTVSEFNNYSVYAVFAAAGGLYLHGKIYNNDKNRDLGINLGSALIYSTLFTQILKMTFGRERPTITDDNSNFHFFETSWDKTSFPSGHATAGFAFASVMALSTDNDIEKTFYWTVAGLMALERLYNNHHWLSDVILGSAIGYFTGSLLSSQTGTSNDAVTIPLVNINYRF